MEQSSSAVNQSPAVPVSPAVVTQVPPGNKKLRPINVSQRGLLLLLAVAVIFLVVLVFMLLGGVWNNSRNVANLKNQSQSTIGRTANFQKKELEKQKTYLGYVALFQISLVDYKAFPSDQAKNVLEQISSSAQKAFPNEYKKADFVVPCVDEAKCLSGTEVKEVTVLISAIKESTASAYLKEAAIKDLVGLKSYEFLEESRAINYYNQAFVDVVAVLDMDKSNSTLKTAIISFEKLISKKFPVKYQFYKDRNGYRLTNKDVQAQ